MVLAVLPPAGTWNELSAGDLRVLPTELFASLFSNLTSLPLGWPGQAGLRSDALVCSPICCLQHVVIYLRRKAKQMPMPLIWVKALSVIGVVKFTRFCVLW